jgi:hypothetical protein
MTEFEVFDTLSDRLGYDMANVISRNIHDLDGLDYLQHVIDRSSRGYGRPGKRQLTASSLLRKYNQLGWDGHEMEAYLARWFIYNNNNR